MALFLSLVAATVVASSTPAQSLPLATLDQARQATEECGVTDWSYTTDYHSVGDASADEREPILFYEMDIITEDGVPDLSSVIANKTEACLERALSAQEVRANLQAVFLVAEGSSKHEGQ